MGFVLVPVTKVLYGARETAISRDRWLVVVTVVVLCPLRICVISNGHMPVTFLGSFVTLDQQRVLCPLPKPIYARYQSEFFT
jgi:hypothetical protein